MFFFFQEMEKWNRFIFTTFCQRRLGGGLVIVLMVPYLKSVDVLARHDFNPLLTTEEDVAGEGGEREREREFGPSCATGNTESSFWSCCFCWPGCRKCGIYMHDERPSCKPFPPLSLSPSLSLFLFFSPSLPSLPLLNSKANMDSKYLKESVGAALSKGLSAVAVEQPDDPVEYLGNYLLNFVAIEERLQRVSSMRKMNLSLR